MYAIRSYYDLEKYARQDDQGDPVAHAVLGDLLADPHDDLV